MKKLLTSVLLIVFAMNCSGCLTILGGIIGYQSGELAAGLLIGAGADIGLGVAHELKKNSQAEIYELNSEKGTLQAKLKSDSTEGIFDDLEATFKNEGWTNQTISKKIKNDKYEVKWQLATTDKIEFTVLLDIENKKLDLDVECSNSEIRSSVINKLANTLDEKLEH